MKKGKEVGNILSFLLDIVHRNPEKNKKVKLIDIVKQKLK